MSISSITQSARALSQAGVAFAPDIAAAAAKYGLDPRLLAAVAAQETGGPGSNAGRNIVGDGGHGHGVFQIDDRFHAFANSAAAMQPRANADYAAGMIAGLLKRYGGDVHEALSAYNAGSPRATGTVTQWTDGARLGYADSVLRHYANLACTTQQALTEDASAESPSERRSVNALFSFASMQPPPAPQSTHHRPQDCAVDFGSIIFSGEDSSS
ncbi:MAG TPA: transglycosylase SLT domain-containing protein [Candidatus Baltobacteraceae bacterium]|nr:transglycosylase SLT domain-containing protein [Candidatus Baltobacteraceae bacterium]